MAELGTTMVNGALMISGSLVIGQQEEKDSVEES